MKKHTLKSDFERHIKENPELYPFISNFWQIDVNKLDKKNDFPVKFGHFQTESSHSTPFYKPFSKIIDFSKINE